MVLHVIGIVGGVASGKSFVAAKLRELGAEVLDVDQFGHEVLGEDEVRRALCQRWGDRILDSAGQVDRASIARIVFSLIESSNAELEFLENLTFPRISGRIGKRMDDLIAEGSGKVLVLDAAVMTKAGWDKFCNKILYVDSPRDQRLRRAVARGWNEAEFDAREAAQVSLDFKRQRAHRVIDNSGSIEQTSSQIKQFWQSLD